MFKIGKVKLENNIILAPMAGVNCGAFRLLCKEYGAGLTTTAMVVANNLVNNKEQNIKTLDLTRNEHPISIQLVGNDSNLMGKAAELIEPYADIIDINLGCPEKDILALKAGSFLIKHPEQIEKVISPVISATNKPVTAKIRIGWDENSINTLETVKILEDLGVSAIAIHGRTKSQKYTGKADWNEIKKAKEKSNVPIIGNGDITLPGHAKSMIEQTGCDAVMIGRGAIGNPLIFKSTSYLLNEGKNLDDLNEDDQIQSFFRFCELFEKQERQKFSEFRQHAMWFTKGLMGAAKMRKKILSIKRVDKIKRLFE
ncbi:tRNA dihydrouridine synthase DusB [Nanoarchaeota archaeon]